MYLKCRWIVLKVPQASLDVGRVNGTTEKLCYILFNVEKVFERIDLYLIFKLYKKKKKKKR